RAILRDASANLSASLYLLSTWDDQAIANNRMIEALRQPSSISARIAGGTVDVIPTELDMIEANHWRWQPRPVIQSYSAYTPALDQRTAAHLSSPQSADHIILQWDEIDGRHPLLDDAASWRALFDRYDIDVAEANLLLLKRRNSSRYLEPRLRNQSNTG